MKKSKQSKNYTLSLIFILVLVSILYFVYKKNEINIGSFGGNCCDNCIVSRQSPANIITKNINRTKIPTSPLTIHYGKVDFTYKNTHYGKVKPDKPGNYVPNSDNNYIMYNGTKYILTQFHYHTKSEHKIDSEQYDAEIHFVHTNPNYNKKITTTNYDGMNVKSIDSNEYVVIGLMFSNDKSNTSLFNGLFDDAFLNNNDSFTIDLTDLNQLSYYSFPGSLTSNPFNSTITWFLSDEIIKTNLDFTNKKYTRAHSVRPIKRDIRDSALYFAKSNLFNEHY